MGLNRIILQVFFDSSHFSPGKSGFTAHVSIYAHLFAEFAASLVML
jgi:hypothetical protein